MHKDLPAKAWGDGRAQSHAHHHLVPIDGEVGVSERPALPVHKDMGLPFLANVLCEQLVPF